MVAKNLTADELDKLIRTAAECGATELRLGAGVTVTFVGHRPPRTAAQNVAAEAEDILREAQEAKSWYDQPPPSNSEEPL